MFKKVISWYKEKKPKKKKQNRTTRKIDKLNEIIVEQADNINFLIEQSELIRNKNIELARQVRELKKQLKEKSV